LICNGSTNNNPFECDSLKAEKNSSITLIIAGLAGWTFQQFVQSCVVAGHTGWHSERVFRLQTRLRNTANLVVSMEVRVEKKMAKKKKW
jgi:hypothetical protein